MNRMTQTIVGALTLGVSTCVLLAQGEGSQMQQPRAGRPGGPDGPGHRPPPGLVAVLDTNHDGVIDAVEIENASVALKTLDTNGDGQLTPEDRPERPAASPAGPRGGRQRAGGPGKAGRPGGADGAADRPPPPVVGALDANHDRVIDAVEIGNASAALIALDQNGDGQLTMEEIRPPRSGRRAGGPPPETPEGD